MSKEVEQIVFVGILALVAYTLYKSIQASNAASSAAAQQASSAQSQGSYLNLASSALSLADGAFD